MAHAIQRFTEGPRALTTGYTKEVRAVGRPGPSEKPTRTEYVEKANFVFFVTGTVFSRGISSGLSKLDEWSGWIVRVRSQNEEKSVYLRSTECGTRAAISRRFAQTVTNAICRLSTDEFYALLKRDTADAALPAHEIVFSCGRYKDVWVYPDLVADASGARVADPRYFVTDTSLRHGAASAVTLPSRIPLPLVDATLSESRRALRAVLQFVRAHFGDHRTAAVHVLSRAWLAAHRSQIMETEKQLSVLNVHGPPNVGKSFLCALACSLLSCDNLIVSNTTWSSIVDLTNTFRDLLVVWDDPRSLSAQLAESIVHESFHGMSLTSHARGVRHHNASLVLGTQRSLYERANLTVATKSRLATVEIAGSTLHVCDKTELQGIVATARGAFRALLSVDFDQCALALARTYKEIRASMGDVIDRSVRSASIDVVAMQLVSRVADVPLGTDEVEAHVASQHALLAVHCSLHGSVTTFVRALVDRLHTLPRHVLKACVNVNEGDKKTACVAVVLEETLRLLQEDDVPLQADVLRAEFASHDGIRDSVVVNLHGQSKRCTLVTWDLARRACKDHPNLELLRPGASSARAASRENIHRRLIRRAREHADAIDVQVSAPGRNVCG